ncbi:hypothetical protein A2630_04680 [Candidatus Woesebacteria bacterium RIFCSPHIGHO2_01_FULL_44_10]|uniref:Uncharacterized protein n=1 Tax=Candidatus Woesebacteria bacterium RIFCSPLOWO2_01_FULL_44_14 TaxID=1802525 RepID=A0A1F8C202_9BACT|nr:MAG: hypothetical protein A2630_04680 [Candidatus Woesebacteria bacterium RIFCSPHIGHO2_01_FULL_44_10]OGM55852.1 MAG: hypothetical protein A3F62_05555 [Candidatus Woesebacteria bacterium RIFCSPHIGHO2_12_FULL_44_11]OGM69635.1 MAG: hypothetical protein A2975_00775 [Candidatus Woesebacteria bacterium RIFCSPLOWO2_01_FULL_44_14]
MLASSATVWSVAKIFALFGLGVYIIFAFVIVRQVAIMVKTLEVGFELPIRLISLAHLLFAIGIFIFALMVL